MPRACACMRTTPFSADETSSTTAGCGAASEAEASSEGSMRKMMTIRVRWIKFKHYYMFRIVSLRQIIFLPAVTIHRSRKNTNQFQTKALKRNQNKSLQLEPSSSCSRFFSINLSFKISDMHHSVTLRFAAQLHLAALTCCCAVSISRQGTS